MLAIITVAAVSFMLSCCKKEENPELVVTGSPNVVLTAEGASVSANVIISTSHTDWDVVTSDNWLHASKNGQQVKVSAEKNQELTDRIGTVTIYATADSKLCYLLNVTQKGDEPYIKINGLESCDIVFTGDFDGKSGIDYKQTINITSNVNWEAQNIPSWLSVSPKNGNGAVTMTIYPMSENASSTKRSATINLTGGGKTAKIEVEQIDYLSNVKVTPTNLVALYNQIGYDLKETGKVNIFHWLCVSEREMNRMTDKELLEALLEEESNKFVDDYMFFPAYDSNGSRITQNTTYYICTVAFDVDDKRGEVVKSKVTTPSYQDADNDAWVSFPSEDMTYASDGFQFTAVKEGFCDTYHVIFGNLPSDYTYPAVAFAFEINYYMKYKTKHWFASSWELEIVTNYPNNHTFTYYTDYLDFFPLITIYARGVFKDGRESSDMTGGQWDISNNGSPRRVLSQSTGQDETVILRRSIEEARAKEFFSKK